jgi:hypothetical protein
MKSWNHYIFIALLFLLSTSCSCSGSQQEWIMVEIHRVCLLYNRPEYDIDVFYDSFSDFINAPHSSASKTMTCNLFLFFALFLF